VTGGLLTAIFHDDTRSRLISVKLFLLLILVSIPGFAHDIVTTKITFNREIIRIFNTHCVSCHHSGGIVFSLTTYQEVRPWAKAIEEEVLQRRMPPWGAVKGFGNFRNDQGLTMEQLELIVDWAEGGAPEGEQKDVPASPTINPVSNPIHSANELVVSGETKLAASIRLDGLWPKRVADNTSFKVTAELPDGAIFPLLWLYGYKKQFDHPFLLRTLIVLPVGSIIHGIPADASVALLSASRAGHQSGAREPDNHQH